MLHKRILVALIGIPLLVFLILTEVLDRLPFMLFCMLLTLFIQDELYSIFLLKKVSLPRLYYLATGMLLVFSFYSGRLLLPSFLLVFLIALYASLLLFKNEYSGMIHSLSFYSFGMIYGPFLIGHFYLLKSAEPGKYYFLILALFIWASDTFAYFTGSLFGKKKLPLKASPNKSYAGVIGGLLFSFLSLFLSEALTGGRVTFPLGEKILIAVLFGFLVLFADLIESGLKRSVRIKDSGKFLPGHGGLLDRFDTWLLALPLFYYYLRLTGRI